MDRFKLMGALRHLIVRIEGLEMTHCEEHAPAESKELRRQHNALRAQYTAVVAKLGGHPTIDEWAGYQDHKRNGGAS